MNLSPLTSLQASLLAVVTASVSIAVGFGLISSTEQGVIVSAAGILIGAVLAIANSIVAVAHGKVIAAKIAKQ